MKEEGSGLWSVLTGYTSTIKAVAFAGIVGSTILSTREPTQAVPSDIHESPVQRGVRMFGIVAKGGAEVSSTGNTFTFATRDPNATITGISASDSATVRTKADKFTLKGPI